MKGCVCVRVQRESEGAAREKARVHTHVREGALKGPIVVVPSML